MSKIVTWQNGVRVVRDMTADETAELTAANTASIEHHRAGATLTRYEFARRAASAGYVTWDEAADWAAGNGVPASVQAVIDALPEAARGPARLEVMGLDVIRRSASLMTAIAAAFDATDADLDALFGIS